MSASPKTGYAVFEFDLVVGSEAAFANHKKPADKRCSFFADPSRYEGGFYSHPDANNGSKPMMLCGTAIAFDVGRGLIDLVTHLHVPTPHPDHRNLAINCRQDSVEMLADGLPIAHWQHWYCDWEPTHPQKVSALVGYKTTLKRDFAERFFERNSLNVAVWCNVKMGTRQYSHTEFTDYETGFWIDV